MPLLPMRESSKNLWAEIKANAAKLDACPMHTFVPVPRTGHPFLKDFVCKSCGGKIDGNAHLWYIMGRKHGVAAAVALVKVADSKPEAST